MKETWIVELNEDNFKSSIEKAGALLKAGKTVAFPTETVYGLGANALDEKAILGIYEAKGRPSDNPLIVHISSLEMLAPLIERKQPYVEKLIRAFWPGPIAMIFEKAPGVPLKTTGGLNTVAIRMPSHPVALALIDAAGVPIAAPSANISGKPSPTVGKYVVCDMNGRVDGILDGGEVAVGLESTVIDVTGDFPVILRPGKITKAQIIEVVGACEVDPALEEKDGSLEVVARAPGMKYRHYAPDAKVSVYYGDYTQVLIELEALILERVKAKRKVAVLLFEEDYAFLSKLLAPQLTEKDCEYVAYFLQGSIKQLETFAKNLFRNLREADEGACEEILIRGVSEEGIGKAIMNRLEKASEGRIFKI